MGYVIYGDRRSGSAIVELCLAAAGVPFEFRRVPLESDAQLGEAYRAINPMSRLPAMLLPAQDGSGGTVVTESLACALVVAENHPEAGLMPPVGSPSRAEALRWMVLLAAELYPAVTRWDYPARFADDPAGVGDRAMAESRRIWSLVDGALTPAPFATGERFGVLDAQIAVMSRWSNGPGAWVDAHCPKVAAITHAVATHPPVAEAFHRHFGAK
jgi:GST-like protein